MHYRFLTEDQSSKIAMDILAPKILENCDTYSLYAYKGIGHIPKGLKPKTDAKKRILLDQLPRLLQGFGNNPNSGKIIVICDLDHRDRKIFLSELKNTIYHCNPKPDAVFCLAIEEFEAWYLGDLNAIRSAYPRAKNVLLKNYVNDSICDTWELLADAVYKGGRHALIVKGNSAIGKQKSIWAKTISPYMDVNNNASPSFNYMLKKLCNDWML